MKGVVNPSTLRSNLLPELGKYFPSQRLYFFSSQRLCLCDDEARAHSPQPPTLEDHGLCSSLLLKGLPVTVMAHSPEPPTFGDRFAKKRKILVVDDDDESKKEIRIERRDEYGRIRTPKGPGKPAQEKRKKLHEEESRSKQLQFNTDKPWCL